MQGVPVCLNLSSFATTRDFYPLGPHGVSLLYVWSLCLFDTLLLDQCEATCFTLWCLLVNFLCYLVEEWNGTMANASLDESFRSCLCRPAPKNEDEMMVAIFEYIDRIFAICRPRKLLYMAIDGVVCMVFPCDWCLGLRYKTMYF